MYTAVWPTETAQK